MLTSADTSEIMSGTKVVLFLAILVVLAQLSGGASIKLLGNRDIHPVVIIPGDAGSQLEAKLNKKTSPHFYCQKNSGKNWIRLWLSVSSLLPGALDCWCDNIQLHIEKNSEGQYIFHNTEGVETRVPGFGDTFAIEYIDPDLSLFAKYFYFFVDHLVKNFGYVRKVSIASVPYDFRLAPSSTYIQRVTGLIEKLYAQNNNKSVLLVSHSMGSLVTLNFLNKKPQHWKDKYIRSWTSIAGVFGGSTSVMRLQASGDNQGIPFISSLSLKPEQSSYETNFWMLPDQRAYSDKEILIKTNHKNFTVNDMKQFFEDIKFPEGFSIYNQTRALSSKMVPPGVATHLMIGHGVKTSSQYVYTKGDKDNWFQNDPTKIIYGDGDGTVNINSLFFPKLWNTTSNNNKSVEWYSYENINHMGLVSHKPLLDDFVNNILQ